MKRIVAIMAGIILPLSTAAAQNATLDKIEKANAGLEKVKCSFSRTRTLPATGKVIKHDGVLYFVSPDKLSMQYDTDKESLIIDGKTLYMKRLGKGSTFDTDKNALMRSLRNMLLNCIRGKVRQVAEDNNADVSVKEVADYWHVTLKAKGNAAAGFSRISLSYRKKDGYMVRMETVEFSGVSEVYTMSDDYDAKAVAGPEIFKIPKR